MKRFGLGVVVFTLIGIIYYFTFGSKEIVKTIKKEVKVEVQYLEKEGFNVTQRYNQEDKEYFIISINDSKKVLVFFQKYGINFTSKEIDALKGVKIALNLTYLKTSIDLDIYPVELPTVIKERYRKVFSYIREMLDDKALFIHINFNYLLGLFEGYIKDIDKSILYDNLKERFTLKEFNFSGEIKNSKIIKLKQNIGVANIYVENSIDIKILGVKSNYNLIDKSIYEYSAKYDIDKMELSKMIIDGLPDTKIIFDKITLKTDATIENSLAKQTLNVKVKNILIDQLEQNIALHNIRLDMFANRLEVKAFKKLQKIENITEKALNSLLQRLIANNMRIEVLDFEAKEVTSRGKVVEGFSLYGSLDVDKSLNIINLKTNPIHTLDKFNADIDLSLSKELLNIIIKRPEAMIAYMTYRAKTFNGKKTYSFKIKDGMFKINGKLAL